MKQSNRKTEKDIFGRDQKLRVATTKQIRKVEEGIKKRKRVERKAINNMKHKVEE